MDRCLGRGLVRRVAVPAAVALGLASVVGWTGVGGAATVRGAQGVSSEAGAGVRDRLCCWSTGTGSSRRAERGAATWRWHLRPLRAWRGRPWACSLGGHHYVIPSAAVPYLDHGLNWTLFDVSALATAEKAGRLPVRISYGARLRALPGVTITRSGGGLASGYLTASSARVFGAALIRQFRADHRTRQLRPGRDVRGRRVGRPGRNHCRGDRPSGPSDACPDDDRDQYLRQAGQRRCCLRSQRGQQHAVRRPGDRDRERVLPGSTKFSVPAGCTRALGLLFDPSGATRLVVLPHFDVPSTGTTTVPVAESLGEQQDHLRHLEAREGDDVQASLLTESAAGPESEFTFDNAENHAAGPRARPPLCHPSDTSIPG